MRENKKWQLFTDLRYSDIDDTLREIARLIRDGYDNPMFIRLLADHIDPDKVTPFGTKFIVKRLGRGTPKKKPDSNEVGRFLWRHIDVWEEPAESVIAAAMAEFGVGRTKCFEALDRYRAMFRKDPDLEQLFRKTEIALREDGHPDCKPFSPGKG